MTATATVNKPFFRADQVGSLLRPAALLAARQQFEHGQLDRAGLRAAEDQAIEAIVRRQQDCGFAVVVDGEFRRENWWIDFVRGLSGVEVRDGAASQAFVAPAAACGHDHGGDAQSNVHDEAHDGAQGHAPGDAQDQGWKYVPKNVVTTGKLSLPAPVTVADFSHLQALARGTAKVTIPSPTRLHFHGGRAGVSASAYPDIEDFFADVVTAYRAEIAALEAAGCRYI